MDEAWGVVDGLLTTTFDRYHAPATNVFTRTGPANQSVTAAEGGACGGVALAAMATSDQIQPLYRVTRVVASNLCTT
jgi:hypothetical protein